MLGKRVYIEMNYEGQEISQKLNEKHSEFEYTDNLDGADEISFTLHDFNKKFVEKPPMKGDKITAKIKVIEGENEKTFDCGEFFVDDYTFNFSPDTLNIKAISIDPSIKIKAETKTKIWENTSLKAINTKVASENKLSGSFKGKDIKLKRIEQKEESNGSLIKRLAMAHGFSVKVLKSQLLMLELKELETKEPILIEKGLIKPGASIKSTDVDTYDKCVIEYYHSKLAKKIKVEESIERFGYKSPTNKTLKITNSCGVTGSTKAEIEEQLKVVARNSLRNANRKELTLSFSVQGTFDLVAGRTMKIKGFGIFDKEKYFITRVVHKKGSSGYETSVEARRCNA